MMSDQFYTSEKIENYLGKPIDKILIELGDELQIEYGLNAIEPTDENLMQQARDWFEEHNKQFCQFLSKTKIISEYVNGKSSLNKIELVSAVLDILTTLVKGPALFLTSILIVKHGILLNCKKYNVFKTPDGE